jgi:hypothetical protein
MGKMVYMQDTDGSVFKTLHPEYHSGAKRISEAKGKKVNAENAAAKLRQYFKPGDVAFTVLKSVSRNGMSRHISVIATAREESKDYDGKKRVQYVPVNVTGLVADLLGYKWNDDGSLTVGGCGMDMGFHVVYSMSSRMFPNGTKKPHGRRNGEPDTAGGYAIRHRWL